MLHLFHTLNLPILTFDCEIWGLGKCDIIDKYYLGFIQKTLKVKPSTNTCMIYAETVCVPLSLHEDYCKILHTDYKQ